ncbi:hypothetical protein LTR84_010409 [Exophiala bonariae]|uniref:Uncharacterized protein n=1 Tax=Exophiala bonariae TaxID=1690606 RepID=A0AAV9MWD1_9EURO|nr:hypothetical protein LTR84_010409 [Exophiala bonariae]
MAPTESPLVHKYLWKDHSLPPFQNVVMTVSAFEALLCFSFFAALVTYTQTRTWVCIKSLVFRVTSPIQMTLEPNHPESQERLTQTKALRALGRRPNPQDHLAMLSIPKWFGIWAIINVAVFFVLGVFVPLWLTGFLGTAVVQSKFTDTCTGHETNPARSRYTAELADSYHKRCLVSAPQPPSCSQVSGIVGSMPQLYGGRDWPCPFGGDVCQNDVQPVQLEFKNLRPRDYGVNMKPQVLLDHRVTCAPLKTEKFMVVLRGEDGISIDKSVLWFGHDPREGPLPNVSALYGTVLETANGPNQYSSNFSGNELSEALRARPAYDLNVYPSGGSGGGVNEGLHPNLQRTDGEVFIIVLQPGRTYYGTDVPIDDPFYSAHNKARDTDSYIPDYEATALGCVEQFRLCVADKDNFCTDWGHTIDVILPITLNNSLNLNLESRLEITFTYVYLTTMASMGRLFSLRTDPAMLMTALTRRLDTIEFIDPTEQWIKEIHGWFMTAFIAARYNFMQIVTSDYEKRAKDAPAPMVSICGIVLFQTNEYTNINFIGLLASISSLLLICVISHWQKMRNASRNVKGLIAFICILLFEPYWSRFKSKCKELPSSLSSRGERFRQDIRIHCPQPPAIFGRTFWTTLWEERRRFDNLVPRSEWINLAVRNVGRSSAER